MIVREYSIGWDITSQCNLRCRHCCAEAYYGRKHQALDVKQLQLVMRNVACLPIAQLTFLGGEPLMHPDLSRIVAAVQSVCKPKITTIATNGTLLERSAMWLVDRGVHVNVSFEGASSHVHDAIRGNGTFRTVLAGIRRFNEARQNRRDMTARLGMNYTFVGQSESADRVLALAKDLSIDHIAVFNLVPFGRARDVRYRPGYFERLFEFTAALAGIAVQESFPVSFGYLTPLVVDYLNRRFDLSLSKTYHGCKALSREFVIDCAGCLVPCRLGQIMGMFENAESMDLKTRSALCIMEADQLRPFNMNRWNSKQKQRFPCSLCPYSGNLCEPCWLVEGQEANALCRHVMDASRKDV